MRFNYGRYIQGNLRKLREQNGTVQLESEEGMACSRFGGATRRASLTLSLEFRHLTQPGETGSSTRSGLQHP